MAEPRRGLLARLGLRGGKPSAAAWQEAGAAVTVADAAAAARLAQEAATPFGYRRPAGELLAAFGGSGEEERRRATAALALAGIAADPPLTAAAPTQYVQLRRIEASTPRRSPAAPPAAAPARPPVAGQSAPALPGAPPPAAAAPPAVEPPAPAEPFAPAPAEPAPPAPAPPAASQGRPAFRAPAAGTPVQRVAARFAPRAPVARDRRIAAGALGLGALSVVMIVAVALRGGVGAGDDSVANSLPPATETTAATTRTEVSPPPAAGRGGAPARARREPSGAARAPAAPAAQPRPRPRTVRLRVVPSEEMYVCIADGAGETIWEGMLTGPYEVRRAKLVLRVGVATARISANGRPVRVTTAPGAFELTPTAVRELPGDQPVCGAATTAPPAGATTTTG